MSKPLWTRLWAEAKNCSITATFATNLTVCILFQLLFVIYFLIDFVIENAYSSILTIDQVYLLVWPAADPAQQNQVRQNFFFFFTKKLGDGQSRRQLLAGQRTPSEQPSIPLCCESAVTGHLLFACARFSLYCLSVRLHFPHLCPALLLPSSN